MSERCMNPMCAYQTDLGGLCQRCKSLPTVAELVCENERLKKEAAEHDASFDLRWKADMRAIKRWQKATGKTEIWPDHADLCVWLLEQNARLKAAAREYIESAKALDCCDRADDGVVVVLERYERAEKALKELCRE